MHRLLACRRRGCDKGGQEQAGGWVGWPLVSGCANKFKTSVTCTPIPPPVTAHKQIILNNSDLVYTTAEIPRFVTNPELGIGFVLPFTYKNESGIKSSTFALYPNTSYPNT